MSTATNTAKMIYTDRKVANMIWGKLTKRFPDQKYEIMKIPAGWQIVAVNVLPAYMPPAKPLPVNQKTFAAPTSTTLDAVVLEFPYKRQTKSWWYFEKDGKEAWIHKNHVISAEIIEQHLEPSILRLKVALKIAKEKGLYTEEKEAA